MLANAGSYGIFAEMIRHELAPGGRETVTVHRHRRRVHPRSSAPEEPGEFCFPPIAGGITGAARLLLTLLERCVTDAGGSWMFCDTDSMAIVATRPAAASTPAPAATHRLTRRHGRRARAQPTPRWTRSAAGSVALNPYTPRWCRICSNARPRDLLRDLRQAVHVVYREEPDGTRTILKRSLHGLGRYLDPLSPKEDRRDADGNPGGSRNRQARDLAAHDNPDAPLPAWADQPALSRIHLRLPGAAPPLSIVEPGTAPAEQIKPFNFLVATLDPFGHPADADPTGSG